VFRHTVSVLAAAAALLAGACAHGNDADDSAAEAGRAMVRSSSDAGSASESSAASAEEFCAGAAALYNELDRAGTSDPSSHAAQALLADARAMSAPVAIAADWNAVLDSIAPFVAGEVDLDDPDAMVAATQRFTSAADAYRRMGTYFTEECGFGATTSEP
jgi:hypothetical protein